MLDASPPPTIRSADSPLLTRLLPGPASPAARWYDRAAALWCALALALALGCVHHYGITWDEAPHIAYGDRILAWYSSGFVDSEALRFRTNYFYGGGYDLLGALFRRLVAPLLDPYAAMHLLGALVGVLGLVGTWRLGRALAGPRAGLLALVLLTLNPIYWGHMFNNPKDTPFAAAYVWGLYFMVMAIAGLPRPSRAVRIKLALAVGLALGVRIAGLLLLCFFGLVLALHAAHAGAVRRSLGAALRHLRQLGGLGLGVAAGAWLVMLIGWPWAQLDPLRRPLIALTRMSGFDAHQRRMPFAGEELLNTEIGWTYLPHYFAIQLPEWTLVLLLGGTLYALHSLLRCGWQRRHHLAALALLLLGVAIWAPPIYAIVKGSALYDGFRHFLFVLPPICALAAVTLDLILAQLRQLGRAAQALGVAVVIGCALDLGVTMARLHPQEYVYFNRLVGGLAGAVDRYDTDYYGNSYREALTALQRHLWRTEPRAYLRTIYYYTGCVSARQARFYSAPNLRSFKDRPGDDPRPDFHVGYQRYHCHERYPEAPVVHVVERDGGLLNVVKDLRGLDSPSVGGPPDPEEGAP